MCTVVSQIFLLHYFFLFLGRCVVAVVLQQSSTNLEWFQVSDPILLKIEN